MARSVALCPSFYRFCSGGRRGGAGPFVTEVRVPSKDSCPVVQGGDVGGRLEDDGASTRVWLLREWRGGRKDRGVLCEGARSRVGEGGAGDRRG